MLRTALLGFLALCAFAASAARASDITMWVVDSDDGKIRVINQSTGKVLAESQITSNGSDVTGIHGMARDPGTGKVYLAYTIGGMDADFIDEMVDGPSGDLIGVLNMADATVSNLGDTTETFTGFAFGHSGDLFGMIDSSGIVPLNGGNPATDDLVSVDPGDGNTTYEDTMAGASTYSPIAFNPTDGMMYRAYIHQDSFLQEFEKFDPYAVDASDTKAPLLLTGDSRGTLVSLTWDPGGYFLAIDVDFDLYRITPTGTVTRLGTISGAENWPPAAPMGVIVNPEPSTLALYGLGLLAVAGLARRRRRSSA